MSLLFDTRYNISPQLQLQPQPLTPPSALALWSDVSAACTAVCTSWQAFTGLDSQQSQGVGWLQAVHPLDRDRFTKLYCSVSSAHVQFSAEYRLRMADGQYAWMQHDGIPEFDAAGAFLHYLNVLIDVTRMQRLCHEITEQQALLDDARAQVSVLRDIFLMTDRGQTVPTVVDCVIDKAVALLHAKAGVLYRVTPEMRRLIPYASAGLPSALLRDFCIASGIGCSGQAMQQGRLVQEVGLEVSAFEMFAAHNPDVLPWIQRAQQRFGHSMAMPIVMNGQIIAVLALYRQERIPFSQMQQTMLQAIAAQLALKLSVLLAADTFIPNNQTLV